MAARDKDTSLPTNTYLKAALRLLSAVRRLHSALHPLPPVFMTKPQHVDELRAQLATKPEVERIENVRKSLAEVGHCHTQLLEARPKGQSVNPAEPLYAPLATTIIALDEAWSGFGTAHQNLQNGQNFDEWVIPYQQVIQNVHKLAELSRQVDRQATELGLRVSDDPSIVGITNSNMPRVLISTEQKKTFIQWNGAQVKVEPRIANILVEWGNNGYSEHTKTGDVSTLRKHFPAMKALIITVEGSTAHYDDPNYADFDAPAFKSNVDDQRQTK